ncbi:hypothetical protein IF2G_02339 [Cordyceps javanica]|nr:hypothetical protein IF2G_02339 [Cordyceps javanica]
MASTTYEVHLVILDLCSYRPPLSSPKEKPQKYPRGQNLRPCDPNNPDDPDLSTTKWPTARCQPFPLTHLGKTHKVRNEISRLDDLVALQSAACLTATDRYLAKGAWESITAKPTFDPQLPRTDKQVDDRLFETLGALSTQETGIVPIQCSDGHVTELPKFKPIKTTYGCVTLELLAPDWLMHDTVLYGVSINRYMRLAISGLQLALSLQVYQGNSTSRPLVNAPQVSNRIWR